MTKEQTDINVQHILNYVSPYFDYDIFFNFSSDSEFTVEFIKTPNKKLIDAYVFEKYNAPLPYALLHVDEIDQIIFYYFDVNAGYIINVLTNKIELFSCGEKLRKKCFYQTLLDYAALARKLKQL